jgi:NADH dehydrogenase FAD-containing subunit
MRDIIRILPYRMNFPNSHRVNTIYGEISDIDLDNQIVSVGQTKVHLFLHKLYLRDVN